MAKIKKAQIGIGVRKRERESASAKAEYESSKNPKVQHTFSRMRPNMPSYNIGTDTTGYSAGRKTFPYKKTDTKTGKDYYGTVDRGDVEKVMKTPNQKAYKKGGTVKKPIMKSGGKQMLKRADGSVSQRGLWDNIRANKGSGKKPTAAMLKQERKIKAKSK
jgi:hypothetical protein